MLKKMEKLSQIIRVIKNGVKKIIKDGFKIKNGRKSLAFAIKSLLKMTGKVEHLQSDNKVN